MKWLASFLAVVVLFLSVQPACATSPARAQVVDVCCGSTDCDDQSSDDNTSHEDDCSGCNPFQSSCACCAVGLIVPAQLFTPRPAIQPTYHRVWSQRAPEFPAAVYGEFWQPPKIG